MQVASDFAFIPFGGGARKCVGDQFALTEAAVAIAMLLRSATFGVHSWLLTLKQVSGMSLQAERSSPLCRRYTFRFAKGPESVGMATGATIHTANGLKVTVAQRQRQGVASEDAPALAGVSA